VREFTHILRTDVEQERADANASDDCIRTISHTALPRMSVPVDRGGSPLCRPECGLLSSADWADNLARVTRWSVDVSNA
jgi:hypothetical protein